MYRYDRKKSTDLSKQCTLVKKWARICKYICVSKHYKTYKVYAAYRLYIYRFILFKRNLCFLLFIFAYLSLVTRIYITFSIRILLATKYFCLSQVWHTHGKVRRSSSFPHIFEYNRFFEVFHNDRLTRLNCLVLSYWVPCFSFEFLCVEIWQ